MDWTRAIDIYCERVSAAFWAEPVNALTNIAFIAAGLGALVLHARRRGPGLGAVLWLGLLLSAALVALVSQIIGTAWAASASDAPLWLSIGTGALGLAVLTLALTWAPRAYPDPGLDWPVLWLSGNAIVIGIGSFLFHTVAEPWAGAADTTPILMFILGFFAVVMNRLVGLGWGRALLAMVGFLVAFVALSTVLRYTVGPYVGGSQSYFPAFVALVATGWWLKTRRAHPAGPALIQAGWVFLVSLTFRALDEPLCDVWPLGTHFLWHVLNGLVFWILLRALILHGRRPGAAPAPCREAAAGI